MSASIIQKKAAFATVTGSGSVVVTLDNPISAGSQLVMATGLVQTLGSALTAPSGSIEDDLSNSYDIGTYGSSGQGHFANAYLTIAVTPQEGAQTYTLSFTVPSGESSSLFLAGLCLYELSGISTSATNESASQGLSNGFHMMSDLNATISGLSGGSYGNLLLSVGVFPFNVGDLSDAQAVAAGSGWSLDGRNTATLGNSQPAAIVFESQFVDPSSNPAATFSGSANNTELDGTILVAAYSLTAAVAGGGSGGGGGGSSTVFLGAITEVGSDPDDNGLFLGTVSVISQAPSGVPVPYLGKVRIVTAPAGRPNPTLGQVIVLGSAPANASNEWLGSVATS
jgi:hypothetical protein